MAVAVSWTVLCTAIVDEGGLTKIELIDGLIKKPLQPAPVMQRTRAMVSAISAKRLWLNGRILPANATWQRILADTRDTATV
jgi:hypothetical protein